jgi:hypothetical protein
LQLGLVLFLFISSRHRKLLRSWKPYVSLAVAHLVMAPVYIWNYRHHFASLLYQSVERKPVGVVHLRYFAALIGTQFVLLGPVLAVGIAWLVLRLRRPSLLQHTDGTRTLFLLSFFLPTLLLFTAWSMFSLVKANWMYPCYLTGILLASRVMSRPWARANLAATGVLHFLAVVQLLFYPITIKSDDTWYGWKELAAKVGDLSQAHSQAFVFSADGYKTTAELLFYLKKKVYGPNVIGQRAFHFDFVDADLSALDQRDALFINSTPTDLSPQRSGEIPAALVPYFDRVQELDPILIFKNHRVVRRFRVYFCERYRSPGRPYQPTGLVSPRP